jgi:hypothetical protein
MVPRSAPSAQRVCRGYWTWSVPSALAGIRLPAVFRVVILIRMSDVTRILSAIERGDPTAAEHLLPLVYDELRKRATQMMANERPGQTLEGTALVHEAYVRLVDVKRLQHWNSRGHFFAAAAEAMRLNLSDVAAIAFDDAERWLLEDALLRKILRCSSGEIAAVRLSLD